MKQTQMWFGSKVYNGLLTFKPSGRGYDVAVFAYRTQRGARAIYFLNKFDGVARIPSVQRVTVEGRSRGRRSQKSKVRP
jgi:hypothetical protein